MEHEQWFRMLSAINADDNLNGNNVIEKVKESLKQKDREAYDDWYDNQFNINFLFNNQFTLLHVAAQYNLTKIVELLLEKKAEVNKKNNEGWAPLSCAAKHGNIETVNTLIDKGADINAKNKQGWTPLLLAVEQGHIETVNTLINKKADVNVVNTSGDDPLRFAVLRSSTKIVEALIAKGANVKKKYNDESTPLHNAQDIEIIKILLDKGANVKEKDKEGSTPLHCVCTIKTLDPEIINILIDKGSDVKEKSNNGKTPLHIAAASSNTGVVINLLKKGANCNEKCNDGLTPLHYAAPCDSTQKIKALIENKADVRAEDQDKRTPLHFATGNTANILIEKEANVNATDKDGKIPLHLAVERSDVSALEALVKNKADINKQDSRGWTPLHYAINSKDIAEYLIEKGADINVVDEEGKTPLYLAYLKYKQDLRLKQDFKYQKEIITFLMDKGADPLLGNRDAKFLGYVERLIKNNGVEHSEKGEKQKETEVNNEYELLLLGNNTSLAHIVKREALYDLISEWSSDVHNLTTDNQKKLNTELLSVLRDIPTSCNIEGLKSFLENNKGNGDLKFILDLQRGKSRLTVLHVIPSIRDMVVKKDMDLVVAKFMSLLVEAGADPNISDNEGQTPLHYAAHFNCFKAMRSLLNHRAHNKPDKQGKTPLDVVMTNSKESALFLEQIYLTGEQIKVKDQLYNIIYPYANSLFIDGGIAKYDCFNPLKKFLDEHKKTESFTEVLNLRDCQGRSRVFQQIRKIYANNIRNLKAAEKLLTKAGAIDYKGWESKEYLPKSHTIWENFITQQQEKLETFFGHVSKTKSMNELAQVVKEAIADGVRLNFAKEGSLYNKKYENKYGFVDYVIRQVSELKKNSPNREKDIEIASHIVRYLVSKGAVLHTIYSKFVIDELEEFAGHKDNMKQAFIDYQNHTQKFMEVAKSATSGKVKDAKMDNSTLYLEYSENSRVQVAKITDGARKLRITQGEAGYGRNVIKIGTSEVEIITENGKRNYTNLEDSSGMAIIFPTSLGELQVNLYPQDENKIRVEVTDKRKWEDLKNKKEEIGKDCLFGGRSVYEAIEQGYFERHGKMPPLSEQIISPNQQKAPSWCEMEQQRRSVVQKSGLGIW